MQQVGVELDFRPAGTAAEEVDHAAAPQHFGGCFPDLRIADGFNRDVGAAAGGELADVFNGLGGVA